MSRVHERIRLLLFRETMCKWLRGITVPENKITGNLNLRANAGTGKESIAIMPHGSEVKCYGYYTIYNGTRWYYVAY